MTSQAINFAWSLCCHWLEGSWSSDSRWLCDAYSNLTPDGHVKPITITLLCLSKVKLQWNTFQITKRKELELHSSCNGLLSILCTIKCRQTWLKFAEINNPHNEGNHKTWFACRVFIYTSCPGIITNSPPCSVPGELDLVVRLETYL